MFGVIDGRQVEADENWEYRDVLDPVMMDYKIGVINIQYQLSRVSV